MVKKSKNKNLICIYCPNIDPVDFKGKEHVLPKSFGTFGPQTPTLKCVCDKCNAFFKKELDQTMARDTLEGITRYKKGLLSRETRVQKGLTFSLDKNEETGEYGGIVVEGVDGQTGKLLGPKPQAHFFNTSTGKYEIVILEKIDGLDWKGLGYSDKDIKVFGPSQERHDAVLEALKKMGINYKIKKVFDPPPFLKNYHENTTLPVRVDGAIDKKRKRALVKILFNFAAYYIGEDEVIKSEWDKARNFIRNNGKTLSGRLSQEPFWNGQETGNLRFLDDSYNLRIENHNGSVVGIIQLYNLFTYDFILVENYSLLPEQEKAFRFTPKHEPVPGIKLWL